MHAAYRPTVFVTILSYFIFFPIKGILDKCYGSMKRDRKFLQSGSSIGINLA